MVKAKEQSKNVMMQAERSKGMKIFEVIIGVAAFITFYLMLFTSVSTTVPYLLGALIGAAVVAVFLSLKRTLLLKLIIAGSVAVYTALCLIIGFGSFVGGAVSFWNNLAANVNAHMHWGISFANGAIVGFGEFLFCSVVSAWLGLGFAALIVKKRIYYVIASAAVMIVWTCFGLYPPIYVAVLFVIADIAVLISEHEFSLTAALCYLLCVAVFFTILAPCVMYKGSKSVGNFRDSVSSGFDRLLYGDDSLPEGQLLHSSGMRKSDDTKLIVNLTVATPVLYLKGFVGGQFQNNGWSVTDRNRYVEDGYQGLLQYVSAEQIPTAQFARYAEVSHNDSQYDVSVTNVSANRKYVYAPYSMISYEQGSPYFDLGLRGNVFTSAQYSYKVFGTDRSSERVSQSQWLLGLQDLTANQRSYLSYEQQYCAFVNDVYGATTLDDETTNIIQSAYKFSGNSINTATQLIRAYFTSRFAYSDEPDAIDEDFVKEFFGGELRKANSAYFATAATLIFRQYGFASRYVEGYLVRYSAEKGDEYTDIVDVNVTGNNAHAWTEVYFDGMGWLPIEVTPTYFSEEENNTVIDPTDPDVKDDPVDPIVPTEKPNEPNKPVEDPKPLPTPLTPEEQKLLNVLRVVLPIVCILLLVSVLAFAFLLRRHLVLTGKNRSLNARGEKFGRCAYSIIDKDCKHFGGFSVDNLAKFGIAESVTERCIQLLEKSVYSGDDLTATEKAYIKRFIQQTCNAIEDSGNKRHKLYCKYVRCLGL